MNNVLECLEIDQLVLFRVGSVECFEKHDVMDQLWTHRLEELVLESYFFLNCVFVSHAFSPYTTRNKIDVSESVEHRDLETGWVDVLAKEMGPGHKWRKVADIRSFEHIFTD